MSNLTEAICSLRHVFDKYAGKDGDSKTLSKAELSELLRNEMKGLARDQAEVDTFFAMLDQDSSGQVDFTEYVTFVATLCVLLKVE